MSVPPKEEDAVVSQTGMGEAACPVHFPNVYPEKPGLLSGVRGDPRGCFTTNCR